MTEESLFEQYMESIFKYLRTGGDLATRKFLDTMEKYVDTPVGISHSFRCSIATLYGESALKSYRNGLQRNIMKWDTHPTVKKMIERHLAKVQNVKEKV